MSAIRTIAPVRGDHRVGFFIATIEHQIADIPRIANDKSVSRLFD